MSRRRTRSSAQRKPIRWLIGLLVIVGVTAAIVWSGSTPEAPESDTVATPAVDTTPPALSLTQLQPVRPATTQAQGFVGSDRCRECHPDNHATWYASYHRRMTQVATPEAVIGDFDDVSLVSEGRSYELSRRRGVCWVKMDDPELPAGQSEPIEVPIVMTTGSHHMQVYWYPTFQSRVVGQLPLVYLKETQQWIPRKAAFLMAPGHFGAETGRWNKTCIACHTTHGQPRPLDDGGWDSLVGEFGISCEACHGPGDEHIAYRTDGDAQREDPIVNPADLSHRLSSQVCGHCHSITAPLDTQSFLIGQQEGSSFRPGDELEEKRWLVREDPESRAHLARYIGDEVDRYLEEQFWPDGMVRISGREYNGLVESACFQQGTLSCLTCHELHQEESDPRSREEWADDQLKANFRGDQACLSCHAESAYGPAHTHHAAGSTGSRCYNCHMPHTTYGLLKAIRSHQITSPDVRADLAAGRPNACNLCHLDQTLEWTSQIMEQRYGHPQVELTPDQRSVAASLLSLLSGDAGQRALVAWSMGWQPALDATPSGWQAPFLASLLNDPYDAVRVIVRRSLRRQPGFADFEYDFVGSEQERTEARARALSTWRQLGRPSLTEPRVLLDPRGNLQVDRLQRLLSQRDDRPVNLAE